MAPEIVWRGRTPGALPLTVERDEHLGRWVVTIVGAVRCRDRVLSVALANAVGLEPTSIWVRHVTSLILGLDPRRGTVVSQPCEERPQDESATH
jgi:hypothetical protein